MDIKKDNKEIIKKWVDTIQCINCIQGIEQLPDNSVNLVLTDPPYGISRELNCKNKRLGTTAKLDFNFGAWDILDMKWVNLVLPKVSDWFITFCAKRDIGAIWGMLEKNKFVAIDALVWQKPDPLPLNAKSRFVNSWEALVCGKRPGGYWAGKYEHNIFKFQAPKGKSRIHKTQKPLGLIKHIIGLTTRKGHLVLDPFMGSGTTAIACKELKRHFIGFEISEIYCKEAEKRLVNTQDTLF
jgi:site-specific DNA-methyltransferase (adenine-specific)